MSDYFQPAEDNGEVLSKIILLILGIFIGAVVMSVVCYFTGFGARGPQIAHVDGGGAGAANAMESLPDSGPAAVPDQQQAYAASMGAMPPVMPQPMPVMMQPQYIQTGMPIVMPAQMQQTEVYTQPAPTTLYPGQMIDDQGHQIGRNGLRGNPCVDPPSSHGRAYSRPLQ